MQTHRGSLVFIVLAVLLRPCLAPDDYADAVASPAPIVGGEPAMAGAWPDVVGVIGASGRCTGTLIAPDLVLTAGHCADIEPRYVVTRAIDLAPGSSGDRIKVKSVRAYPSWWDTFDVAVVVLEHAAIPAARPIATACFANKALRNGAGLTVVGFGLATPDGMDANTRLRQARMAVVDAFCTSAPGCNDSARPNGEIAAGGRGVDSCFGDSGGPAYVESPMGPALIGVVSRSLDVAGPACSSGGIYVRADKVVSWIESVTGRNLARVDCTPARPSDSPGQDDAPDDDDGGCSTGFGTAPWLALCAVPLLRRRRATRYNPPQWRRSR